MKPLAHKVRPTTFDEVFGQNHIVGKNGIVRKMLEKDKLFSMIFYGNPGTGKTTVAEIICGQFEFGHAKFNASTDSKAELKKIISSSKMYGTIIIIIDEIHRMNKDIQDYLLSFIEDGTVIMIGITTLSPYHSVNPAIRSRCHLIRFNPLEHSDIVKLLRRANKLADNREIPDDVYDYIASSSNNEVRTAINIMEIITTTLDDITLKQAEELINMPNLNLDKNEGNYYDALSGLQKSIRGSDVDASLHYLARLLLTDDLNSIMRRLLVIAYEDIGLANPELISRVYPACMSALAVGMPEARIIFGNIVIDLALSPKSNSSYLAIDSAIKDLESGKSGVLPKHLKIDSLYKYPHNYPYSIVKQQYLPDEFEDSKYYIPKESSPYEKNLKKRLENITKLKDNS